MPAERIEACIARLEHWGYAVAIGSTVGGLSSNYFSASDEERLNDLQQMLDDDGIQAILFGRGGYGLGRIIDRLNFNKFIENPKWLIGFSDITLLHAHIFSNYGISTMHAPMAGAFNDLESDNKYLKSLKKTLEGKKIMYPCETHEFNRRGEAIGELVGGNLSLIAHAIGTPSDLKTKGKILFLEDVGEFLYNIDRMLYQLKRSGKFNKLAGLIVGGFTNMRDTDRPFGASAEEIVRDIVKEYDFPVCFGFPVSHEKENYALKIGVGYKLKVGKRKVTLEE